MKRTIPKMRKKESRENQKPQGTEVGEAWEVMVEMEEELAEFFQTEIMLDITATAAVITAEGKKQGNILELGSAVFDSTGSGIIDKYEYTTKKLADYLG